jgi:hypothetical protein
VRAPRGRPPARFRSLPIAPRRTEGESIDQRGRQALLCIALLWGLAVASPALAEDVALEAIPAHSTDGVYRLVWSAPGPVVLEEARSADFASARVVYRGDDRASVRTGRSDGTYHYRLRAIGSDAQATASVRVEHHALPRAFAFFGVGLVVFASTVALVARGAEAEEGDDVG